MSALAEKCINIPPSPDACMKDFSHAWKKYSSLTSASPTARYDIPCSPKTPNHFNSASGYIRNVGSSPYFGNSAGHRNSLNVALLQYLDFNALHRKKGGFVGLFLFLLVCFLLLFCFYRRKERNNSFDGMRLFQPLGSPGLWE